MAEFKLPKLGETVESGTVVKLLVKEGDQIAIDQPVMELETGKAVLEVPSEVSGKITKLFAREGGTLNVGDTVLTVESSEPAAVAPADSAATSQESEVAARANDSAPPPASAATAKLAEQSLENGSVQAAPTSKPAPAAPAQSNGSAPAAAPAKPTAPQLTTVSGEPAPAAPSVRRLARELGIDIHQVQGSGIGARITEDDVKKHTKQIVTSKASGGHAAGPLPDFSKWGEVQRQPLSGIRRATAEHMANSWGTVAHVTQFDKADVSELEEMRKSFSKKTEAAGGKLTVTAIALKIIASALKRFPQFNSSLDLSSGELVLKQYFHIGVAVDTEHGLLVPVIRDVDKKNIIELAAELNEVAAKARDRKVSLADMQGGCFTITNLGGIGGTHFTPIVNTPEVAILGISRSQTEAQWANGAWQPRLMLPLSLSYDHRVIDGADGARFLRWVATALEQPFLLTLEG